MKNKIIIAIILSFGFLWSCEDLDVEALNHVGLAEVLGDPDKMPAYVEGSAYDFWKATEWSWPTFALACAGQTLSSSYTNYGSQDMNLVPKQPFANTTTYNFNDIVEIPWQYLNAGIVKINNIFSIVENDLGGAVIDSEGNNITNRIMASGYLGRGLNLGHLGLIFDKAYIIRPETEEVVFSPWDQVIDAAIEDLENCITIAESDNTVIFDGFNGVTLTATQMAELSHFLIAQFEALQARDEDDVDNLVDWNVVKTHAQKGLNFDFYVMADGGEDWWTRILQRGQRPTSARTSWRLIKEMNPSKTDVEIPYPWPDGVNTLPQITNPDDARLDIDWDYEPSIPFPPERGYWYWSTYSYVRYEYYNLQGSNGPIPMYTVHENDLLYAEALIRTGGDKSVAASIINETRVTRGGLPALSGTSSNDDLLRAITYERLVEHSWEGFAGGFFYRRITSADDLKLEPGQFYHLPIPAYELEIVGEPVYTFGGVGNEETPILLQ
ncbi:MAG: RagB/SusD family nutrient uptake outer membrane protein [Marinilabiliaceae bacterium]|jgi:hypothetical protein|nr:RagB/SusD family nutrient uptake outer membrane protein [Marinilabiliaceae bacterium]